MSWLIGNLMNNPVRRQRESRTEVALSRWCHLCRTVWYKKNENLWILENSWGSEYIPQNTHRTTECLIYEWINAGSRFLLLIGIASYVLTCFSIYLMTRRNFQHFFFFQEAFSIILQDLRINTYMNGSFSALPMACYYLSEEKAYHVHMGASSTHNSVASLNIYCLYKFCVYCNLLVFPGRKYKTSTVISGMFVTLDSPGLFDILVGFDVVLYKEF